MVRILGPRVPPFLRPLAADLQSAFSALDLSLSSSASLSRLRRHRWRRRDAQYLCFLLIALPCLYFMTAPPFPLKLALPALYTLLLLLPATSQFFLPGTPILAWVLLFYSSRFIPTALRPTINVTILPTLESVWYGANISDILTRYRHWVLDVLAWFPYGLVHFVVPFVIAAAAWVWAPAKGGRDANEWRSESALAFWARCFGWMNIIGVLVQIAFPCAPPWYELLYGLTPASYSIPGSPAGLARIDELFHSHGYTSTFGASPMVFGAFPSLHAGCATIEALFLSHFFPRFRALYWGYTALLYWATMYLSHHYLVDAVAGGCLATATFYVLLPSHLRDPSALPSLASLGREKLPTPATASFGHRRVWSAAADSDFALDDLPPESPTTANAHPGAPFLPRAPHNLRRTSGTAPGGDTESRLAAAAQDSKTPPRPFVFPPPQLAAPPPAAGSTPSTTVSARSDEEDEGDLGVGRERADRETPATSPSLSAQGQGDKGRF